MHDHLREHRVVVRGHHVTGDEPRVDPNTVGGLDVEDPQGARVGQVAVGGILGVQTDLDRVARGCDLLLGGGQCLALGDADLPLDEIPAGDRFGDGMFDLQAGVHLQEEELVTRDHELHSPCAHVSDLGRQADGGGGHLVPQGRRHTGRRRLLDDLLVAALDGALPLEQMHHVAVGVTEDLHLHVPGRFQIALDEHRVVAEGAGRLPLGRGDRLVEILGAVDAPHAFAATAGGGLHQHREHVGPAGEHRDPGLLREVLGLDLQGHRADRVRGRADPDQTRVEDGLGEVGVLGQEAVPGVDGLGLHPAGRTQDLVGVEVGLDGHRNVGTARVKRTAVGRREHSDSGVAEAGCGPEHPAGDLSTVGDEDLHKLDANVKFGPGSSPAWAEPELVRRRPPSAPP